MRPVSDRGYVFRVSEANYRRLLRSIADDGEAQTESYGRLVGALDFNVTNLSAGDAADLVVALDDVRAQVPLPTKGGGDGSRRAQAPAADAAAAVDVRGVPRGLRAVGRVADGRRPSARTRRSGEPIRRPGRKEAADAPTHRERDSPKLAHRLRRV
jgi:hypothetical protein